MKGRDNMGYDGKLTFDTKIDESGFNEGTSKLGSIAKGGLSAIGGLVAGYATAFGALTKSALDEVASLEQNIGGVETLFKQNAEAVIANSKKAYETAGLSANNYMSTVTSFSASLLQSLGQDTKKAAEYADRAIIDMSDNANKMGTSMEMIQNAYQGFAKQNYTMLDNLKLGYGGTKTEMERLIEDAAALKDVQKELGITVDANSLSFGNIVNAISVMQTEMGIAGTTAAEALTTIEGSANAAKAAWDNFLAGTGSVDELVDAVNTVAEVAVNNLSDIIPRLADTVPKAVEALVPTVMELGPVLFDAGKNVMEDFALGLVEVTHQLPRRAWEVVSKLMDGIQENAPSMITSGSELLTFFIDGITARLPYLVPKAVETVATLASSLVDNLPSIIEAGASLLQGLITGIVNSLPTLITEGPRIINEFCSSIYSVIGEVIRLGLELIVSLVKGLWDNRHLIIENAGQIFLAFLNVFSLSNLVSLGKNLINSLVKGIKTLASNPASTLKDLLTKAVNAVKNMDWKGLGKNILDGIVNGIKKNVSKIVSALTSAAQGALNSVKKFLGIKSPSTRFRDEVGKYMAQGIGVGFEKNIPVDEMTGTLNDSVQTMQKRVSVITQTPSMTSASATREVIAVKDDPSGGEAREIVIHTHVDLDGKEVGDSVTRFVDNNFSDDEELKRRGN